MIGIRQPLPATQRAWMRRDELVLVKDPHARIGGAHPELLPDRSVWRRIERVIEDGVAVGMMLGLFPRSERTRRGRHREQGLALDRIEAREWHLLRRAMDPSTGRLDAPHPDALIRLVHIAKRAAREEIAFDVGRHFTITVNC